MMHDANGEVARVEAVSMKHRGLGQVLSKVMVVDVVVHAEGSRHHCFTSRLRGNHRPTEVAVPQFVQVPLVTG